VHHQQRANAIGMRDALMHQPRYFPVRATCIPLLCRGLVHYRPHAPLPAVVAQQQRQQLVGVEPIGLGALGTPVHFNAR